MAMAQRLLPPVRQAGGGDGARHRRHRQHDLRADEHGARQRAGAAVRRPHAAHRDRPSGLAQRRDPLGPGVVRPGRHGARIREMGLRAAHRPAGRRAGRPRARHRDDASRAVRSTCACRAKCWPNDAVPMRRDNVRPLGAAAAGALAEDDRASRRNDREGGVSADRHLRARPLRRSRGGARRPRAAISQSPWCSRSRPT